MAYSQDYRQMIINKLNSGYSYRKLFAEYGVSYQYHTSLEKRHKTQALSDGCVMIFKFFNYIV